MLDEYVVISYSPKYNKPCECAYEHAQLQHARGACCLQGLRDQHQCVLAAVCVCLQTDLLILGQRWEGLGPATGKAYRPWISLKLLRGTIADLSSADRRHQTTHRAAENPLVANGC